MRTAGVARALGAIVVIVIVTIASFAVYETYFAGGQTSCLSIPSGGVRGQTSRTSFGAVTEYVISGPNRWPNAVTTAPDGSVWFAEQELPGVAHLFPNNGTLVEYEWPAYPRAKLPDCVPWVSSNGIAVWNGRVWATDEFGNGILGVDPVGGSVVTVNTTAKANFPYWLAVGPDGALWFTSSDTPARLGRIQSNLSVSVTALEGLGPEQPLQLKFVNSTLAYISTVDESTNSTSHSCVCTGHVYSFDPSSVGATLTPNLVGGSHRLVLPTSVSYAAGSIWVAQHGGSSVVGYNLTSGVWRTFPTSLISWSGATLPLQVEGSGEKVWFNEHVANKIALLDPSRGILTEYSESDPPVSDEAGIQNDLSIAATATGLWFTSMSGNYIGVVDGTKEPGFSVSVEGTNHASAAPGGNATFDLRVSGEWQTALSVNSSDSENAQSIPTNIGVFPTPASIPAGELRPVALRVNVKLGSALAPGTYTVAVTVTGGGVQQTAYFFIDVA